MKQQRLIDADAYEHAVQGNPYVSDSMKTYVRCSIQSQPTIDAVPLSAVRKAAKKLAYIHQQIDLYGDRPDLHEEEYWLEYLMDEEWEDADIGWE
jgi:hypothetical protein